MHEEEAGHLSRGGLERNAGGRGELEEGGPARRAGEGGGACERAGGGGAPGAEGGGGGKLLEQNPPVKVCVPQPQPETHGALHSAYPGHRILKNIKESSVHDMSVKSSVSGFCNRELLQKNSSGEFNQNQTKISRNRCPYVYYKIKREIMHKINSKSNDKSVENRMYN